MKGLLVVTIAPLLVFACSPIPRPGSWRVLGTLPSQLSSVQETIRLLDGRVMVLGTYQPQPIAPPVGAAAAIFDPRDLTWHAAAAPPVLALGETLTLLDDGTLLLLGGESFAPGTPPGTLRSAYLYAPSQDQWIRVADMPEPRAYFTSTRLGDGRVLVAGGEANDRSIATCDFYDPRSRSWSEAPSLPERRVYHSAVLLPNGHVLLAGGDLDSSNGEAGFILGQSPGSFPYRSEEVYDPTTAHWGELDSPQPVEDPNVVPLPDGHVLFTGGHFGKDPSPFVYLYDPRTGSWSSRADSKASGYPSLLSDGRLLFPFPLYTYDPGQDLWMPATSPQAGLFIYQSPISLDNGLVLSLVGSESSTQSRLALALYDSSGFPPLPGSAGPLANSSIVAMLASIAAVLLAFVAMRYTMSARRSK